MTTHSFRHSIPEEILALSHERDLLRRRGQYDRADLLKRQIEDAGYIIKDNPHGAHLVTLPSIEVDGQVYRTVHQLPSLIDEPDRCIFSVNILARNNHDQTVRCIESVLRFADNTDLEIVLVDNASQDGVDLWAEAYRYQEPRLHVLHTTRTMGEAEARNVGLKQSRGRYILILDASVELTGDIFTPLMQTLEDGSVGVTGLHGLKTEDLRNYEECESVEVDVIDTLCMAFRRVLLKEAGLFDERYRFPYYMDVDFNFTVRDLGTTLVVTPNLPVLRHTIEPDAKLSDAERARLAKRNFYRFREKWGERDDLLPEYDEDDEE
jgi:GT2 family glycosyltransferase